jgi:uncharacterized protein YbjT (DUF2867 family)
MTATTLVVGANGLVGSEVVRLLQAHGETVRRATSKPPTERDMVQLDLAAGTGLDAALDGVERAYLLSPPGYVDQDRMLIPMIERARAKGLKKVVLMTAMGANTDDAIPFRKVELALQASGLAWNVIRPNWFMQNFHTNWMAGIRDHGKILLPVGRAKGSFIDTRDIAAVASVLLTTDHFNNREFDLTGRESLDHDEVAAILSRVSGRKIVYEDIAPEAMLEGLLAAGLPRPYSEFLLVILEAFKVGHAARVTDAVRSITGRAPIQFDQYARDHRAVLA